VLSVEFHSKMNAIGGDTIQMLHAGVKEAAANFAALIVANDAVNFSAGANLMLLLLEAQEANWDEVDMMIRGFQGATMALKHSDVPVVVAPAGLALGGGCEIAIHAKKVLIIAPQSRRSFPARVDFITSPGFVDGPGTRERLGMPGGGPVRVITQLACYGFDNGEMMLESLHPGVTLEQVQANLGWEVPTVAEVAETAAPSPAELRLLREELDPRRLYL
jgi:hypothetical protein